VNISVSKLKSYLFFYIFVKPAPVMYVSQPWIRGDHELLLLDDYGSLHWCFRRFSSTNPPRTTYQSGLP